jgi:hypothetical protein
MISERQLAEYFHSFWQEYFPLLNALFVRRFNAGRREPIIDSDGNDLRPVPMGEGIERYDLVAEMAFEMAIEAHKERSGDAPDFEAAKARASNTIKRLHHGEDIDEITVDEENEAKKLLEVYRAFFVRHVEGGDLVFRPRIEGAGILNSMEGDFCSSSTLFEVKAVNRNLQHGDLRQVVCYLVCGLGSRKYGWTRYCIINPRKAVYFEGQIDDLLSYTSGRTLPECIDAVLDALMEREQPIETQF